MTNEHTPEGRYKYWRLIDWDRNQTLGYKCWRKKFGRGYISVGVGEFQTVVFSFGADSDDSFSSTRWNYDLPVITEEQAMDGLDAAWAGDSAGAKYRAIRAWDSALRPTQEHLAAWRKKNGVLP